MSRPIVVDLFCGGGGASEGIEMAGLHVDYAVNHDPDAIAMHEANHPRTHHFHRSVWDVSPRAVARGRPVRLLWASPDCTHHSRALGGKPREKGIRDLAWVVVDWCRDVRPDVVMLENVPEFLDWGPLHDRSTLGMAPYDVPTHAQAKHLDRPIKERRGEIFAEFIAHLRMHGYRVEWRKLCAADYGAPTTRTRLFLIARCDGEPIVWPAPSHAKGGAGGLLPWRAAAECIDWTDLGKRIFGRRKNLAEATERRIAEGLRRYVLTSADPFLVNLSHGGRVEDLGSPARTLTATPRGGDRALITPGLVQVGYGERKGQAPRCLDIGAPLGTVVAGGAKHAMATAWIAKHYTGVAGHGLERPLGTVTTIDHHGLCTAGLSREHDEGARKVAAFILKYYGEGSQWSDPRDPLHTIVTKARMGLVTVDLDGEPWAVVDIRFRMLKPRELANAQGFDADYDLLQDQLTLADQIEKIGNSVCPQIPAAMVRANITERERRAVA